MTARALRRTSGPTALAVSANQVSHAVLGPAKITPDTLPDFASNGPPTFGGITRTAQMARVTVPVW